MSVVRNQLEPGAYCDSIILMRLRGALEDLPGILEAGAVMATETNLSLLAESGLLLESAADRRPDDLLVAVRAESEAAATAALEKLPTLLRRRGGGEESAEYRPKSLAVAVRQLPAARWVLVSVPGRFAARVAREALLLDRNVFLYSDNVELTEEVELKRLAEERGLLVMGPDCGTAIVGGVGLGFANRVRRGAIGLVGASGTGLQAITAAIHAQGGGVSQALGTGGRDLSVEVGGSTALAALSLLVADEQTEVIVLISKPPAPSVASALLSMARGCGKPVVVCFLGSPPPALEIDNLNFAHNLQDAAQLALAMVEVATYDFHFHKAPLGEPLPGFLRGLFAGGTLAQEAVLSLGDWLSPLRSNVALDPSMRLEEPENSQGHCIVDLGADELTVGRLHPMIDQELRLRRIEREAADPQVGLILLDVVLGDGAHADPAAQLAPAITAALARDGLEIVVLVVGTDEDPQDLASQVERLEAAGATVFRRPSGAWDHVRARLAALPSNGGVGARPADLAAPLAAINIGVESFYDSLVAQDDPMTSTQSPKVTALHVEWRPPAGGDARMMAILDKLRSS